MRLRKDKIRAVVDIKKVFLHISVAKEDCDFLLFFMMGGRWKKENEGVPASPCRFWSFMQPLDVVLHHHIQKSPVEMQETADILM